MSQRIVVHVSPIAAEQPLLEMHQRCGAILQDDPEQRLRGGKRPRIAQGPFRRREQRHVGHPGPKPVQVY